jgi:nitroimidazol reductase NimA-like FMN-containing flavoprotein (pyridoxamine 5'-phosphate oxidase superfamily)
MGSNAEPRTVRRRDRAVADEAWMRRMLESAPVGVLSLVDGGRPVANVNLFVLDRGGRAIYLHTAGVGHTRELVSANPCVCFTVARTGRVLPADTALEFSVEYASVVVHGAACVVEDAVEARAALQALLDKYAPHLRPGRDYRPITPGELRRTTVVRVAIDTWHGKEKRVEGAVDGAYLLEADGWFGL